MSGIKDQKKIDSLRERLYKRGRASSAKKKRTLTRTLKNEVPTEFSTKQAGIKANTAATTENVDMQSEDVTEDDSTVKTDFKDPTMASKKKRKEYRIKILFAGLIAFVGAILLSSAFLFFGSNNISGENISVSVTGPFVIGGGEVLPLQVGITNKNTIPIESATLIVNYPSGTKSAEDDGEDLYTQRLALETIDTGETVNIPLRALVYGEQNEEKVIEISVEYRVEGSNATFFKEAEPLRFKISSSPVVLKAETLQKISSGQETEIILTISSNAPTTIPEVLIQAEYPLGFDYSTSNPEPVNGKNTWRIENLEAQASKTIKITGVVLGKETDEYAINFTAGVPSDRDPQSLASVFATAQTAFEIERPFLGVDLSIDGSNAPEVAIDSKDRPRVDIDITNTLDDTLYNVEVEVQLSGNAFSIEKVSPSNGFYDTSTNSITWDSSNTGSLQSITPGGTKTLSFTLQTADNVSRTPQVNIDVNVKGRRVSESSVSESLIGSISRVIKVVSAPQLRATVGYNTGVFTDVGPIPPEVDEATTYTLSMRIENGSNDLANAVVSTTLPPYVTYLENTAGTGSFSFNNANKTLEWNAGDVGANEAVFGSFQVSLLPRVTQIGTTPTLMNEQRIKATDRFTGTVVRASSPAITTNISSQSEYSSSDGVVEE